MAKQANSRNGTVDLMKFLFTVVTMCFHTGRIFPGGYIAVEFFFIVSGFLMATSMDRKKGTSLSVGKDAFSFVWHKAGGIFPFYILAWIFSFLITQCIRKVSCADFLMELFRSPYNIFMLEMCGNYDMGHRVQASWYISAMLLAMLIIYPIRKKKPYFFDYVAAPLMTLLFVGYIYQGGYGISVTVGYISNLYMYSGLLRAIAEISLGCFCYRITQGLPRISFTRLGQITLSCVELGGYALVGYMSWNYSGSDKDLVLLLLLALCVSLSFYGKGIHAFLLRHWLFSFLGKFSLCMYLTHEVVRTQLIPYIREAASITEYLKASNTAYFALFFGLTAISAALCYWGGNLLRRIGPAFKVLLGRLMVKTDA